MDLDLDEIRRATEAATEGPWSSRNAYDGNNPHKATYWDVCDADEPIGQFWWDHAEADAAFIAGARQWVPALVAEVERLRAALVKYGWHIGDCPQRWGVANPDEDSPHDVLPDPEAGPCDCGFAAALGESRG